MGAEKHLGLLSAFGGEFFLMFIKEKIEDNPELQKEEQTIKNDLHEIRKEMAEIFHTLEEGDDAAPAPKEKDKRKDT